VRHWGNDASGAPAQHKGSKIDCPAPECRCECPEVVHDSDCPQSLDGAPSDDAVWTACRVYNESVREGASHPAAMHAALLAVMTSGEAGVTE
jgi:hypothetical protein